MCTLTDSSGVEHGVSVKEDEGDRGGNRFVGIKKESILALAWLNVMYHLFFVGRWYHNLKCVFMLTTGRQQEKL